MQLDQVIIMLPLAALIFCVEFSSSQPHSSAFQAPWSFTLNASQSDTCSNLIGNSSKLCFVKSSASILPSFTLSLLLSTSSFDYLKPQIVWTANRHRLVSDGALLALGIDGNLVLSEADGTLIWSSNTLQKNVSSISIDAYYNGRLALYNSTNGTVWSSFDSPTDTIMQYQMLAAGQKLVSNLSSSDAAEGPYSLVLEPGGLVLYFDTGLGWLLPYWTYGIYGLDDLVSVLHTCHYPVDATFEEYRIFFSQDQEEYSNSTSSKLCSISDTSDVVVDYLNDDAVISGTSSANLDFLRIEADGALRAYSWAGNAWVVEYDPFADPCLLPNRCGHYGLCTSAGSCGCPQNDTSGGLAFSQNSTGMGCVPVAPLSFPSSCNITNTNSTVTFVEVAGIEYVANQYLSPDLASLAAADCKSACLTNCSCKAAFYYNDSRSCYFASDQLWTMHKTNNQSHLAFIKVEKLTSSGLAGAQSTSSSHKKVIAISVSLSVTFFLLAVFVLLYLAKSRKRIILEDEMALRNREEKDLDTISFRRFSFKELHEATSGFSSRRLGAGGFGEVFEGQLLGRTVAIKRLKNDDSNDFRAEVEAMGTVNHMNLVRLEGFCAEESHRLLVYEYMCNGSLDSWIFDTNKSLTWDIRIQIAKGIADCLVYLHEQCRDCILHLDIKPQNVLLDGRFFAKVSDFGLSRLLSREAAEASPMRVRGTFGYIAPELFDGCVATPKADVYSFGIVLWELVSGRRVLEPQISNSFGPEQAFCNVTLGKWDGVIDSTVYKEVKNNEKTLLQVKNTMRLAYWCIQYDQNKRPSMSNIVQQLHSGEEVLDPPLSRTFMPNWTDFLVSVDAASVMQAVSLSCAR